MSMFSSSLQRVASAARRAAVTSTAAHRLAGAFASCQRGSVLPIIAFSFLGLVTAAGLALDGSRLMLMNSSLQSAIDAGGLSAIARVSTTEVEQQVRKFTEANLAEGSIGATLTSVTAKLSADRKTLTVTASAEAPSIFVKILGVSKITSTATTEIARATGGLEVALVLDVTGSMQGSKLASLKTAAKDLLDIVFGTDATVNKLYVGLVPFAHAVNIGTTRKTWLTSTPGTSWKGCVEERFNGLDTTDDPPSVQRFPLSMAGCPPAVTPLTSTKATLVSAVDKLVADGRTHISGGAIWGWRMLSPKWRGQWGGPLNNVLPLDYGSFAMKKAVVIMTDGRNEWSAGGSYGDSQEVCTASFLGICFRTSRYFKTDDRLKVTANTSEGLVDAADAELDKRLSTVCTSMKTAGITVYTVAFGSPGTSIENRLRDCASMPEFFFNSPTGADLRTAFAKIGDSLSNLRVSR